MATQNEQKDQSASKKGCRKRCFGKGFFGLALIGGLVAAACCFTGCHRGKSVEAKSKWIVSKIERKLDLNAQQAASLEEIRVEYLAARERSKAEKEKMHEDVFAMILSDKVELAEVQAMINKKRARMDAELPNFFPKVQAFHASLTAEQKEDAVKAIKKIKKKWHK